jgi:flagellar motor switch protein FliG
MPDTPKVKLTGLKKAAIVLVALGPEVSAEVLKEMSTPDVEKVTKEIAKMENVPPEILDKVNEEFRQMVVTQDNMASGGFEYAKQVAEQALGSQRGLQLMNKVRRTMDLHGFNILDKLDTDQLLNFVQKEHPQTICLVLNLVGQTVEKGVLTEISQRDPDLASEIKNLMFVFEDIRVLDDRSLQRVLKDVDMKELSLALKAGSDEIKTKILSNLSERASAIITEEMEYMGPVKLRDVEKAQQRIVDVVRRLDEEGEIVMGSPGAEDEIIV